MPRSDASSARPRVVIVGAGFGGLTLARSLRKAPVEVLLVDQHNYHTFQPLLYQVATAGLEPEEVAHAVRGIFQGEPHIRFRLGRVTGVDWDDKAVRLADGGRETFDYLVLAAGAVTSFFGVDGAQQVGFELKSLNDALTLRSHVMRQFERADQDAALVDDGVLTFVVVGGGPTGVELSGALTELFQMVLRKDYPHLAVDRARVVLVEMADGLLTAYPEKLQAYTRRQLEKRGVDVRLGEQVVRAEPTRVHLKSGASISAHTLVWAAGVKAHPLAEALGLEQAQGGRIVVEDDLSVPGRPDVFVIGDLAASREPDGTLHPQLAPVAMQGAKHVADQIQRRINDAPATPFRYVDKGTMATIGRNSAVAELAGGLRTKGFVAWLMWLFLHLLLLVGFRNRLNVLVNWAWNYVTYDRSARLIMDPEPPAHRPAASVITEALSDEVA